MKIITQAKREFDSMLKRNPTITDKNVEREKNLWLISINDSVGTSERPYFKKNHRNVLNLFFDNVEKDIHKKWRGRWTRVKAFTDVQARSIIRFLRKIEPNEKTAIFIHCSAGISRSGAVGEFCAEYFRMSKKEFKRDNPHIFPNPHVRKVLNREYRKYIFYRKKP